MYRLETLPLIPKLVLFFQNVGNYFLLYLPTLDRVKHVVRFSVHLSVCLCEGGFSILCNCLQENKRPIELI